MFLKGKIMKIRHLFTILSLGLVFNMGAIHVHAETASTTATTTVNTKVKEKGGWKYDGRWWYQNSDGSYPKAQWKLIHRLWYYFDTEGYMLENTWVQGMYYVGSTGAMLTDTVTPDGYHVGPDGAWIANPTDKPVISSRFTRYTSKLSILQVEGKYQMFLQGMDMNHILANDRAELKAFDKHYTVSNAYFMNYNKTTGSYTKSVGPITLYINKDAEVVLPDGNKTTAGEYYDSHANFSVSGDLFKASVIMFAEDGYVKYMELQ